MLVRERVNLLALDSRSRLLRTLDVLDTAVSQRGRTTLAVAVERLLASLGANLYANELARTNVRRYLELLEQMEARGEPVDAASVRKRVRKLYAEPAVTPGAVDVMTIHKSKGLEWDLVLLPGLHKLSARDDIRLLDWMELPSRDRQGRAQMLLAPVQARGDEPGSLNQFIRKSRLQHSRAELKRLLYVAATRARTSLQIFASPATDRGGNGGTAERHPPLRRLDRGLNGTPAPSCGKNAAGAESSRMDLFFGIGTEKARGSRWQPDRLRTHAGKHRTQAVPCCGGYL